MTGAAAVAGPVPIALIAATLKVYGWPGVRPPTTVNGVRVESGSSFGKMTVWLSPDIVAFNNTLKVEINGKPQRNVQPKIDTLLEDVRTRGDRQHPFWAKVSWPD